MNKSSECVIFERFQLEMGDNASEPPRLRAPSHLYQNVITVSGYQGRLAIHFSSEVFFFRQMHMFIPRVVHSHTFTIIFKLDFLKIYIFTSALNE